MAQLKIPKKNSLVTVASKLNATTVNQGDHCILAYNAAGPGRTIDEGNLTTLTPVQQRGCSAYLSNPFPVIEAFARRWLSL
jgi:hypothetical protein